MDGRGRVFGQVGHRGPRCSLTEALARRGCPLMLQPYRPGTEAHPAPRLGAGTPPSGETLPRALPASHPGAILHLPLPHSQWGHGGSTRQVTFPGTLPSRPGTALSAPPAPPATPRGTRGGHGHCSLCFLLRLAPFHVLGDDSVMQTLWSLTDLENESQRNQAHVPGPPAGRRTRQPSVNPSVQRGADGLPTSREGGALRLLSAY